MVLEGTNELWILASLIHAFVGLVIDQNEGNDVNFARSSWRVHGTSRTRLTCLQELVIQRWQVWGKVQLEFGTNESKSVHTQQGPSGFTGMGHKLPSHRPHVESLQQLCCDLKKSPNQVSRRRRIQCVKVRESLDPNSLLLNCLNSSSARTSVCEQSG